MIKIGVCADCNISAGIRKYIADDKNLKSEVNVFVYTDSEQMVDNIENNKDIPDIIFCETDDTLDIIEEIRRKNDVVEIVLLLPKNKKLGDIILYRAFGILTVPLKLSGIKKIIEKYKELHNVDKNCLIVTVNKEPFSVQLNDILYFESRKRIIYTHGLKNEIHFYKTIRDLEKELSDRGFVRCHRSFLVNAKYVEEVHREYLIIRGEKIPVGRDYYEQGDGGIWKSLRKWNKYGAIIGVGGAYDGVIFRIKPEVEIIIGKDARYADIVINDAVVSDKQGIIIFHQNSKSYSLWNVADEVIVVNDNLRILQGESVSLKTGDVFGTEDSSQRFELG